MELVLVAALSDNRVIGRDGGLPWHLPADLAHFKRATWNRTVIMGRRTFESMLDGPPSQGPQSQGPPSEGPPSQELPSQEPSSKGAAEPVSPLPHRRILVLTRQKDYCALGAETATDLDAALALAAGEELVCILGGEAVYREALPRADAAWLTRVHAVVEGDTYFPELPRDEWRRVEARRHPADAANAHAMTFEDWRRVKVQ